MRYYWRCETEVDTRALNVFTHFTERNRLRFQDDRPFLARDNNSCQPYPCVLIEDREVSLPEDVESGEYNIVVGLYYPEKQKRVAVSTDRPTHHNAVLLPCTIDVP